jgi:hypothetical protein
MNDKPSWKTVIDYRKRAIQILLNRGEITPLPSQSGLMTYKSNDHAKIVKLAEQLRNESEATK